MEKILKIEKPLFHKKALISLLDASIFVITTVILYFFVFLMCFKSFTSYSSNINFVNSIQNLKDENGNEIYNLKLSYNNEENSYLTYAEQGVKYYEYYEDEIVNYFTNLYKDNANVSDELKEKLKNIKFLYNINFLGLPSTYDNLSISSYSTDYYRYQTKVVDGATTILWDEYGVPRTDKGEYNARGISQRNQTLYNSYQNLISNLKIVNSEYNSNYNLMIFYQNIALLSSGAISYIIYYLIIPLFTKYCSTIGKIIFGLGYINTDGTKIKKYKHIIRTILSAILLFIGLYWFNTYTFIILIITPYLCNLLYLLLNKNDQDIFDKIFRIELVDIKNSLIFKSKDEEDEYFKNLDEEVDDTDKEYTDMLSKMSTLEVKGIEEKIEDEQKSSAK